MCNLHEPLYMMKPNTLQSQADGLDDDKEKQQACLDALAEIMKAYQDAASMIKKKVVPWSVLRCQS